MSDHSKTFAKVLAGAILLYYAVLLGRIIVRWDYYQWDFKTFFYAGKAHAEGLNPYGLTALAKVAGGPVRFRFIYPPVTLWVFRLFSLFFRLKIAYYVFLALKVAALSLLLLLWKKIFLKSEAGLWFVPFALVAFNSSIFVDLMAGNISVFEQAGLWLAFYAFLKQKYIFFSALVVGVACFKITPVFFLLLLIFARHPRKWLYLLGSLSAFAAIQGISFATSPLFEDFLVYNRAFGRGTENPSTYSLFVDLLAGLGARLHHPLPSILFSVVFGLFGVAVLIVGGRAVGRLFHRKEWMSEEKDRLLVFFACLTYAVLVPRFLAYSHIILIVPAYFALKRFMPALGGGLFFILAALQIPQQAAGPGTDWFFQTIWTYSGVIIGWALWVLYKAKMH